MGFIPERPLMMIIMITPGRGLPYGSGLGLSRCLGPGECLHSIMIMIIIIIEDDDISIYVYRYILGMGFIPERLLMSA